MYERGGKALKSIFKTYKYSIQECEDRVEKPGFNDIVNLLRMCGESKSGLTTYCIKLLHGKTVFDTILDSIL